MRVVIRADAGPGIGGGHAMRCLALASVLTARGADVIFVCRSATSVTVPALSRSSHQVLVLEGSVEDEAAEIGRRVPTPVDLLVVDHYGWAADRETQCRAWARRIMVIDDLANRPHDCDLLLDQTLGRSEGDYRQLVPEACQLLLGTDYALLRPEFAWRRVAALRRRNESRTRGVLVSFGATGPDALIDTVLDGLSALKLDAIDVIVGASHPEHQALRSKTLQTGAHVRLLTDVRNVAELMEAADLAIGAAGSTCWERCCLGLPTVMIATAENQRTNAESLQAAGAGRWLGFAGDVRADDITLSVSVLLGDQQSLGAISRAAASICDGRGANRVVSLLFPGVAKTGEPVLLRPARMGDAQTIFEWQTIPELRRFSRSPGAPTWDEHNRWMQDKLNDPNCHLSIVMLAGRPVGVLRLDRLATDSFEVSILVVPIAQGIGVGRAALDCAARLVPESHLCAHISPENKASQHLFASAGYHYAHAEIGAEWVREPEMAKSTTELARERLSPQ